MTVGVFCFLALVGSILVIVGIQLTFKDMPIGWDNAWARAGKWLHTPSAKAGLGCLLSGFIIIFCLMVVGLW